MSYYINQLCTPSFPIVLVETEVIVKSVETGVWRGTLVVGVVSVDAYSFFFFLASFAYTFVVEVPFNIHHKNWLTYSEGIDRPGEFCYNLKQPCSDG